MELKDRKLINNGGIPTETLSLEDRVSSGIGVEGTTGLSTLTDRKYIKNLPKFEDGTITPGVSLNNLTTGSGITGTMAMQIPTGPIKDSSGNILKLPTGLAAGNNLWKTAAPYAGQFAQNAVLAIDFVNSISSGTKYNKTADDLLQDAGSSEGNIGGVSYQTLNDIDASQVAAQEHAENKANTIGLMGKGASLGASIGSVAGPVGSVIGGAVGAVGGFFGGLFGGGKRHAAMRRRVAEALDKAIRQNGFSRSGALTSVLQQQYAREYGDTESQSLYGFSGGKEGAINPLTMTTVKNHIVETSHGKDYGPLNSWTEKDEVIWDTKNDPAGLNMHIVDHGPNDGARSFLTDSDAVFSRKGNMNLKALANAGNPIGLQAILNEQADMRQRKNKGLFAAKYGKLPGFVGGKWGTPEWLNTAINSIGLINAGIDYNNINNEAASKPDTTTTNQRANPALNVLSNLSFNPYPGYKDIQNVQDKRTYATRNNAGLSAAQRAVAEYDNYHDTMESLAKFNQYALEKNSAIAQLYAKAELEAGEDQANRDMLSKQFDYNAYNQAHGARMLMASQRKADMMSYLNNWAKGVTDMHNWRKMYNLYLEDVKNRKNNNSNTANTVKSWGDIYNDMGINKTADYANTTSDAAWTNAFRKKFNPTPLSEEERYARNIENLGLNSLFYTPPMPENYINPLKYISTRRSNKRKNKKS